MTDEPARFNGLAVIYRWLEWATFGSTLMRARLHHLDALQRCRSILVIGDGDGRCLAALASRATDARLRYVDASDRMLQLARARTTASASRITFECADVATVALPSETYDAVVTCFVLDCFTPEAMTAVVRRLASSLRADARWVFVDFAEPSGGWGRAYARMSLPLLYWFFRWSTGIRARALPPSDAAIESVGFECRDSRTWRGGFVRSAIYQRVTAVARVGDCGA